MEQNGQNNGYQHNMYGHGDPSFDNGIDFKSGAAGYIQNDSLGNADPIVGTPLNTSAIMNNYDVALGLDGQVPSSNSLQDGTTSAMVSDNKAMVTSGPRPGGSIGMLSAHAVGPARSTNSRSAAQHHPYARAQPIISQTEVKRNTTRRAVGRSKQTGRNDFTRPRSQLNAGQSQSQSDMTYTQGTMSTSGHVKTGSSSSSSSISPVRLNNLNNQAFTPVGVLSAASTEFVRPVHHQLDSTRIDPAGPEPHSDPDWRAPGPSQWTDILYDHTILQFMSDASIKDLLRHCDRLVSSGVPDPSNPEGPALLVGSRFTVLDAQAAWNYCTAYSKRRQQLRNNSAASRSRNSKAAQLKHWKALAIAAGAPNREFNFDASDPANASGASPDELSAVTQAAIAEMKQEWAVNGGPGGQGFVADPATGLFPGQLPQFQGSQAHMQQQVYGQPQNISPASVMMASPSVSTAPETTSAYQGNEVCEDFKLTLPPVEPDLIDQLEAAGYGHDAIADFDFGHGNI